MFSHFWGVGLVLTSLFVSLKFNGDLRNLRDFFFVFYCFLSFSIFGIKPTRRFLSIPILIILGFFTTHSYNSPGFNYQFLMLSCGLILMLQMNQKGLNENIIKGYLIFLAVLSGLWSISNKLGFEPYGLVYPNFVQVNDSELGRISGPLLNNTLSAPLCSIGLLMLNRKNAFLSVPMLLGLYLYGSTMAILMPVIGFIYLILSKKDFYPNLILILAVGLLICAYFFIDHELLSGQERNQVWKDALSMGSFNGLGYFHDKFRFMFKHNQIFIQEHNEYLSLYISFGIPGLLILLGFLINLVEIKHNLSFKSALVSMLFLASGSFPFHISALALITIVLYTITKQGENYGFFKYEEN